MSSEIVGIIVGAILAGCIGIFIALYAEYRENRRTKKNTSIVLLSECEANQNLLQPLDSIIKVLDEKIENSNEYTIPYELNFDRIIYSTLADKIGLFDNKIVKKIVQYYMGIKNIEEQYSKLELYQGFSPSALTVIKFKDEAGRPSSWNEIEDFLRNVEKVYDLGEDIVKCLKMKI